MIIYYSCKYVVYEIKAKKGDVYAKAMMVGDIPNDAKNVVVCNKCGSVTI